jgi:hypothetical protein
MAIHSERLATLEAVLATALNIVKNRTLADLYVRRDYTGEFRVRVQLESGQRYVITIDSCIPGHMTPPTARDVLVGVAPYGQLGRNFPGSGGLPLNDACAGTRFCGAAEQRDEVAPFHYPVPPVLSAER